MIGATALPTGSPYFDVLIYGGIAAIAVGFLGLVGLLIWPSKRDAAPPQQTEQPRSSGGSPHIDIGEVGEVRLRRNKVSGDRTLLRANKAGKLDATENRFARGSGHEEEAE